MAIDTQSPKSCFFTDSSFTQTTNDQAFKALNENEFQITTSFQGNLKAYAVTDGQLFFAKYADSSDKINIILKPSSYIDVGIKIKYFVYRGIKKSDFFKLVSNVFYLNDTSNLPFLNKVWQAYTAFNGSNADFTANKIGYDENLATSELIKKFYKKYDYQLLTVSAGDQIGSFIDGFGGFEIVLDEGDYSTDQSGSGLYFNTKFATAKSCKLNADGVNTDPYIFGGKELSDLGVSIFRENIYQFLDPAAFFGLHITKMNNGNISVYNANNGQKNDYSTSDAIFNNVVSKFLNKNKVYFYIKEKRNRSYNFYEKNTTPIALTYQTGGSAVTVANFDENKWPIKVIEDPTFQFNLILNLIAPQNNCIYVEMGCNGGNFYSDNNLIYTSDSTSFNNPMIFKLVRQCATINYLSCSFGNDIINNFGAVNSNTLFDEADFSSQNSIGWVFKSNSILHEDKNFITSYNTKVVVDNTLQLRTYLLEPLKNNLEPDLYVEEIKPKLLNAAYSKTDLKKDSGKFCDNVLGISDALIWRGEFKDGTTAVKSLALRKDENIYNTNRYLIGISQAELDTIKNSIPASALSVNPFFKLTSANVSSLNFAKYSLQIEYDDKDGNRMTTTNSGASAVTLYTIDGLFFFTKNYSDTFYYYKEFAKIAAEFRPGEDWMKYFNFPLSAIKTTYNVPEVFYGFDWLRKGDYLIHYPSDYRIYESYGGFYDCLGDNTSTESNNVGAIVNTALYFRAKKIYRSIPVSWKMLDGLFRDGNNQPTNFEPDNAFDKDYAPSWLHIPADLIGSNHPLSLKIRMRTKNKTKATRLKLYFNKNLFKIHKLGGLTNPTVNVADRNDIRISTDITGNSGEIGMIYFDGNDIPDINKVKWIDFGITNLSVIGQQSIISVYDNEDNLVGKLYITPNSEEVKKKALVVLVKHTSASGTIFTGEYDNHELELTRIFAKQVGINPDISVQSQILDLTMDADFQKFVDATKGIDFDVSKTINGTFYRAHQYLLTKIADKTSTKIFVVKRADDPIKDVMAFTVAEDKCVIMYSDFRNPTSIEDLGYYTAMAHEYLHAQGVAHTFAGLSSTKNAFLTFTNGSTNNVMDYSNANISYQNGTEILNSKFVQSTFFWQWAIARRFAKKY